MEQMPPLDEITVPGGSMDSFSESVPAVRPYTVVQGTVVHIDPREGVLVDVGTKSEGVIRPSELSRPGQEMENVVSVGDVIDVFVLEEGKDGVLQLSKKRAEFEKSWDRVQRALGTGETLTAVVSERVRGGLVVDLGIRGFVPASHVGNGRLKNLDKFVGQTVPLKVLEVDRGGKKVVLSHRKATEEEREAQKRETEQSLTEGQERTGVVRRVTDYGAFVDLGGIDGLLHVSEMSWTRVKHPSDVVKVGQEVQVKILRLNLNEGRVSLGMRQVMPDPWDNVAATFNVNDVVEGEVTRIVPFGAFVLLPGGIEGIIPNSESAHRRMAKASEVVEAGQTVSVKVIDVRPDERRLTLSLRALQPRDAEPAGPITPRTEDADSAGRRAKKDRKRRGEEEGGGDFRQFLRSGTEFGTTLGDMFGDMFSGSKRTEKKRGGRRREEDDDDLTDIDAELETTEETPAEGDSEATEA
ncbi:MAG: 30S ribosomal protein S1 [Armatimonadaceae bacterium]